MENKVPIDAENESISTFSSEMSTEREVRKRASSQVTKKLPINEKFDKKKKAISKFFSNEHEDSLNDFEIPLKVSKKTAKPSVSTMKKTKAKSAGSKKQADIRKSIQKKPKINDLSEEEQFQLALALSRQEAESTNEKTSEVKSIIDQFAYQPNLAAIFNSKTPKKKASTKQEGKWKSKYTPLTRRDENVQREKQKEKIDQILLDNIMVESRLCKQKTDATNANCDFIYEISSSTLRRICLFEKVLFEMNQNDEPTIDNLHNFYTNNLVDVSELSADHLLRDWAEIPGRDDIFDGLDRNKSADETQSCSDEITEDKEILTSSQAQSFEVENKCEDDDANDEMASEAKNSEATIIVDEGDMEYELDVINTQIRLSQNFSEPPNSPLSTQASESNHLTSDYRATSPDLFDDNDCMFVDDFDSEDISGEIGENRKQKSKSNKCVDSYECFVLARQQLDNVDEDVISISDSNSTVNVPASSDDKAKSPSSSLHNNEANNDSFIEISDSSQHSKGTGNFQHFE